MIEPLVSAVNLTPSSTADVSPESIVDGVPKSKIVSCGVVAADAADAGPVPRLLVADTVNVYAVPFVKPVTVAEDAEPLLTCTGVCAVDPMYGVTV